MMLIFDSEFTTLNHKHYVDIEKEKEEEEIKKAEW